MTTESQRYNCFIRNGGNAIPKHAGPEAEGSNPTTGLTLLWARNPFGGNFNHWQVSWEEAGQIRETGTGQQMAQLHDRLMMMMMMMMMMMKFKSVHLLYKFIFISIRDAKKMCKKLKVSPEPFMLKHYKDGDFHKDYDRLETMQSMVNFMRDPSGDIPWEEDSVALDVVHISDALVSLQ